MIDFEENLYKRVKVVTVRGEVFIGELGLYCSAYDGDDPEDSIGILPDGSDAGILLFVSEIKDVQLLG